MNVFEMQEIARQRNAEIARAAAERQHGRSAVRTRRASWRSRTRTPHTRVRGPVD
jgi:hypothetical protein